MTSTYNAGVHRFAVFTVGWTILLFVAGALVTSKDAALSVTDWPKSHGSWVPPLSSLQGGDFFEFSHRFVAGGLGILTLVLAVLLLKESRVWLRWLGGIAVLGVVVQAVLGGQVVIRLLHYWLPVIYAQVILGAGFRHKDIRIWPHAVGALVVLGTVTWTAVAMRKRFGASPEFRTARILLHSIFGTQFLLG